MGLFRRKKKEEKVADAKKEEKKEVKVEEKTVEKKTTEKKETSSKATKETKKEESKKTSTSKKEVAKESTKKSDEKEAKSKKPIYRVLYDKESKSWLIKKDGAKRTITSYSTKEEALNRVKELSSSNDLNYIVHKKDGKFQKK